jgi:hypothetical protein
MRKEMNPRARNVALILVCWSYAGCGDDDAQSDAGIADARAGDRAGSGGAAQRPDAGNGRVDSGASGTGGASGEACTEPPPQEPVVCGGQTCAAPTFAMNPCVVPCCIDVGDTTMCGAKSTSATYPAECTLPAVPDRSCPTVSAPIDAQGTIRMFEGCCNAAQGKCGVVGWTRPGCITESTFIALPNPPSSCGASTDAGAAEDAGR